MWPSKVESYLEVNASADWQQQVTANYVYTYVRMSSSSYGYKVNGNNQQDNSKYHCRAAWNNASIAGKSLNNEDQSHVSSYQSTSAWQ